MNCHRRSPPPLGFALLFLLPNLSFLTSTRWFSLPSLFCTSLSTVSSPFHLPTARCTSLVRGPLLSTCADRSRPPVGSFLRPKEIHEAREANLQGSKSDAELRKVEDAAIKTLVKQQEDAGLRGVSDGEFRVSRYFSTGCCSSLGVGRPTSLSRPPKPSPRNALALLVMEADRYRHVAQREYFHLDFLKHVGGVTVTKNKLVEGKAEAARRSFLCSLSHIPRLTLSTHSSSAHRHWQAQARKAYSGGGLQVR